MKINNNRGFVEVSDSHRKNPECEIKLPLRGTEKSAGYDFCSPHACEIPAHTKCLIWSDVKAYMNEGEVLKIYVRSSTGIKKGLMLANQVGIIDADYYSNPDNDGNIGICLYNYGEKTAIIEEGERIAQGIFESFLVSDNGNTDVKRVGGTGSTNEVKPVVKSKFLK